MRKTLAIMVAMVCWCVSQARDVAVMVRTDDASSLAVAGAQVTAQMGGVVTALVPEERLAELRRLPQVSRVSRSHLLTLCNDSARLQSDVMPLHHADIPSRGRGVLVGMIDVGVDFNHVNLCDAAGRSRVLAAYMPCDSTGAHPVIDGMELPGSCYETPEQIAALTTDTEGMSHGTHTTGTAAGSYMGNDWYGMAPEADLVICAMPGNHLSDVNIANGLRYIFDFAERRHQPCVVNMSIGDNVGAHDGSSELCHVMESLVGPGRIIVVSAGNDGDKPTHVSHRPKSCTDSLRVLLQENATSLRRYGFMSVWNTDAGRRHHGVEHVVVDRNTGAILYRSDCVALLPADSVYAISSGTHPEWSKYFTGEVLMATERGENGWYHSYCEFDATATDSRYLFGFLYNGDAESQMEGWCYADLQIDPAGLNGFAQGDGDMSISDLATTDAVISVGAYCSRTRFKRKDGKWENYKKCQLGEIAPFSSYGPDMNGNSRPDVTAPGVMVLSSASRFDSYLMNTLNMRPPAVTWNGQTYPYAMNQGTSMSTPVVTGTVALWLEANPDLTPADVRDALRHTCYQDEWVSGGDRRRWGFGKLDAAAGWRYVQATAQPDVHHGAPVVEVWYCDLTGRMSPFPFNGVNIVMNRHADGSVSTYKMMK